MAPSTKKKYQLIEKAIASGRIGAKLGAMLLGKSKNAIVSSLMGTAISASAKALKEAKKIDVPVMFEEDNVIYRMFPDGTKEEVKVVMKPAVVVPSSFKLD